MEKRWTGLQLGTPGVNLPSLMSTVDSSVWGLPRWTAESHSISWSTAHHDSGSLPSTLPNHQWLPLEGSPNSLALVSETLRVGSRLFPVLFVCEHCSHRPGAFMLQTLEMAILSALHAFLLWFQDRPHCFCYSLMVQWPLCSEVCVDRAGSHFLFYQGWAPRKR